MRPVVSRRHGRTPRAGAACFGVASLGYVAFALWPRWPESPRNPGAPSLPITVAGVAFNIPPAAIRMPVQRRAGAQARLDLAFRWPDLTHPPSDAKSALSADPRSIDQIFVSIASADDALSLAE